MLVQDSKPVWAFTLVAGVSTLVVGYALWRSSLTQGRHSPRDIQPPPDDDAASTKRDEEKDSSLDEPLPAVPPADPKPAPRFGPVRTIPAGQPSTAQAEQAEQDEFEPVAVEHTGTSSPPASVHQPEPEPAPEAPESGTADQEPTPHVQQCAHHADKDEADLVLIEAKPILLDTRSYEKLPAQGPGPGPVPESEPGPTPAPVEAENGAKLAQEHDQIKDQARGDKEGEPSPQPKHDQPQDAFPCSEDLTTEQGTPCTDSNPDKAETIPGTKAAKDTKGHTRKKSTKIITPTPTVPATPFASATSGLVSQAPPAWPPPPHAVEHKERSPTSSLVSKTSSIPLLQEKEKKEQPVEAYQDGKHTYTYEPIAAFTSPKTSPRVKTKSLPQARTTARSPHSPKATLHPDLAPPPPATDVKPESSVKDVKPESSAAEPTAGKTETHDKGRAKPASQGQSTPPEPAPVSKPEELAVQAKANTLDATLRVEEGSDVSADKAEGDGQVLTEASHLGRGLPSSPSSVGTFATAADANARSSVKLAVAPASQGSVTSPSALSLGADTMYATPLPGTPPPESEAARLPDVLGSEAGQEKTMTAEELSAVPVSLPPEKAQPASSTEQEVESSSLPAVPSQVAKTPEPARQATAPDSYTMRIATPSPPASKIPRASPDASISRRGERLSMPPSPSGQRTTTQSGKAANARLSMPPQPSSAQHDASSPSSTRETSSHIRRPSSKFFSLHASREAPEAPVAAEQAAPRKRRQSLSKRASNLFHKKAPEQPPPPLPHDAAAAVHTPETPAVNHTQANLPHPTRPSARHVSHPSISSTAGRSGGSGGSGGSYASRKSDDSSHHVPSLSKSSIPIREKGSSSAAASPAKLKNSAQEGHRETSKQADSEKRGIGARLRRMSFKKKRHSQASDTSAAPPLPHADLNGNLKHS